MSARTRLIDLYIKVRQYDKLAWSAFEKADRHRFSEIRDRELKKLREQLDRISREDFIHSTRGAPERRRAVKTWDEMVERARRQD